MRILILALASTFLLTVFVNLANAQDATSSTTRKDKIQERVETRKENAKERVETKKEVAQTRRDAVKDRIGTRKENIASKTAALKERVKTFKDKAKATRVEKINDNLNKISENRTNHFKKFLDNATRILAKLEERVTAAGSEGKDTSTALTAIADARAKIASAQAAVDAQAAKDYTVTVSSESTVKTDAQTARTTLHTDLQTVMALLKEAKNAVASAIRVAATTLGGTTK